MTFTSHELVFMAAMFTGFGEGNSRELGRFYTLIVQLLKVPSYPRPMVLCHTLYHNNQQNLGSHVKV